jgi:hypothetical protein
MNIPADLKAKRFVQAPGTVFAFDVQKWRAALGQSLCREPFHK